MRGREAVILAGGFGTRLASLIPDLPKPMAPVAGRPFLRFVLDHLSAHAFERVVIADGYKRQAIEGYFGDAYRGMEILYSHEDAPLLTGGAVKKAFGLCKNDFVFVVNGDTYFDTDYDMLETEVYRAERQVIAVIACAFCKRSDRYGLVERNASSGAIASFAKPEPGNREGLINAGTYIVKRDALSGMPAKFSLESDFFERIAPTGSLHCSVMSGVFVDIGIPEDYRLSNTILAPLAKHWRLAFFDRDGTINVDVGHLHEPGKLKLIDSTVELVRHYNSLKDWRVVVVTNQAGIAKGLYSKDQMHELHRVLNRELAHRGAHIDAFYYCPHHPDHTGECHCRKPQPGMISKALFDFEALPHECVLYGDRGSDIEAARAAGVEARLVERAADACHGAKEGD